MHIQDKNFKKKYMITNNKRVAHSQMLIMRQLLSECHIP